MPPNDATPSPPLTIASPTPPPKSYKTIPRRGTFTERNALTFQSDLFDVIIASNYAEERQVLYSSMNNLSPHYIYTRVCDALGWLIHQEELKENFESKYHHIQLRYKIVQGEQGIELRHRTNWSAVKLVTESLKPLKLKIKQIASNQQERNINSTEFRDRVTKWFEDPESFNIPNTISLRLPPTADDIEWMTIMFNGVSESIAVDYVMVDDVTVRMVKVRVV